MKYTEKYGLRKPESTDFYNVEDFNNNMDIIEEELDKTASTNTYGMVKLSDSTAVTDSTGLALPTTEKNASISGTLANQILKTQSLFFGGRTYMSFQGEYLLSKEIALPDEFASKDVNNFYVVVTLEQDNTQKVYTPFVQKATGCFTVFVRDIEGAFVSGQTIWFNYIVIIRH